MLKFLCDGQGIVRRAILYGDRSCYGKWELPGELIHSKKNLSPFQLGLIIKERICSLEQIHSFKSSCHIGKTLSSMEAKRKTQKFISFPFEKNGKNRFVCCS